MTTQISYRYKAGHRSLSIIIERNAAIRTLHGRMQSACLASLFPTNNEFCGALTLIPSFSSCGLKL